MRRPCADLKMGILRAVYRGWCNGSTRGRGERETGLEPATCYLEGSRSARLSYSRVLWRRTKVRWRWQLEHTTSHFAASSKIRLSEARPAMCVTTPRLVRASRGSHSSTKA